MLWLWGKGAAYSSQNVVCDATTVLETKLLETSMRGNDRLYIDDIWNVWFLLRCGVSSLLTSLEVYVRKDRFNRVWGD